MAFGDDFERSGDINNTGYNGGIDGITIGWCEHDAECADFMNFKWGQFYTEKDCLGLKVINRFEAQRKHGGHPLVDWAERPRSIQWKTVY